MSLFDTKDKHEFQPLLVEIEQKPTSPLGRGLLWSLFVFMVISLLWLFLAKIDVVVTARGKVIPSGEIKTLQPIETGTVATIFVKEGMKVKKGNILIELDPSVALSDSTSKQKNLDMLSLEIARLHALVYDKPFFTSSSENSASQQMLYNSSKIAFKNQQNSLKDQLAQIKSQINSEKADKNKIVQLLESTKQKEARLAKVKDIIARNDYEEVTNKIIDYTEQINIKAYTIIGLQEKINEINRQIEQTKQEYKNKLLEELTQKTKEVTMLKTELDEVNFRQTKQKIIAPTDGYIGKMFIHTVGGVVTPAEKLLTLIPSDVPLVIKATVLNQDIGFIEKNMHVAIKIDTFDFQKYGLVDGVVTHIAEDAIEDEKLGAVYDILIHPKQTSLIVDGEKLPINAGMSVSAEMKVGKRRVIEFFVYPIVKYLDEGMSVK
jgi:hemolysin D